VNRIAGIFAGVLLMTSTLVMAAAPTSQNSAAIEDEAIHRVTSDARRPDTNSTQAAMQSRVGGGVDVQRVVLALAIVIAAIFVARWVIKRMYPGAAAARSSQVIRVVSRSVVGPKQQFLLVQLGKRLVLVGDSGASMNSLAQIEDPDEVACLIGQLRGESSSSSTSAFSSIFRKAGSEFEQNDQAAPSQALEDEAPARELVAAAGEITGLMDRVRTLSKRLRQPG